MLEQFTSHEKSRFLSALFIGICLGFAANYSSQPQIELQQNALVEMSSKITYATITESVKHCNITAEQTSLYSEPSTISGKVLRALPQGMQVDHLATVPSLDTDSNKAVTAYDLEYKQFIFKTIYIPKGTPITIKNETSEQYYCNFVLNGKVYTKHFEKQLITRAYTKNWHQVQIGTDVGFVQATQTSEPKYL